MWWSQLLHSSVLSVAHSSVLSDALGNLLVCSCHSLLRLTQHSKHSHTNKHSSRQSVTTCRCSASWLPAWLRETPAGNQQRACGSTWWLTATTGRSQVGVPGGVVGFGAGGGTVIELQSVDTMHRTGRRTHLFVGQPNVRAVRRPVGCSVLFSYVVC